jgi:hypothetical protein
MRLPSPWFRADLYEARFERGPWHGSVRSVPADPAGGPPDLVPVLTDGEGVYALAGGADVEGLLPYWWMPWERVAKPEPTRPEAATRTSAVPPPALRVRRVR